MTCEGFSLHLERYAKDYSAKCVELQDCLQSAAVFSNVHVFLVQNAERVNLDVSIKKQDFIGKRKNINLPNPS